MSRKKLLKEGVIRGHGGMSREAGKTQTVRPLSAALRYDSEALHVVPLHGLKDGRCTCGDADCCQPEMHPRTKNGVADATSDLALIENRWTKWSKAKIGIVFGGASKLLGLMTDVETGRRKLGEITRTNGKLTRTVTILDGDRETRLFRFDGNYPRSGDVTDNVRVLGEGDFVVAPSSLDDSTGKRRFARGRAVGEVEIAQAPHWLFKITAGRGSDIPATSPQTWRPAPSVVLVRTSEIEPERDWLALAGDHRRANSPGSWGNLASANQRIPEMGRAKNSMPLVK